MSGSWKGVTEDFEGRKFENARKRIQGGLGVFAGLIALEKVKGLEIR